MESILTWMDVPQTRTTSAWTRGVWLGFEGYMREGKSLFWLQNNLTRKEVYDLGHMFCPKEKCTKPSRPGELAFPRYVECKLLLEGVDAFLWDICVCWSTDDQMDHTIEILKGKIARKSDCCKMESVCPGCKNTEMVSNWSQIGLFPEQARTKCSILYLHLIIF